MKANRRARNKRTRSKVVESAKQIVVRKKAIFLGLSIEKSVSDRKITKTDLMSWPASIVVGFGGKTNSVLIEYSSTTTSDKDLDLISSFFSKMKSGEKFTIVKGTTRWSDGVNKPEEKINGEYKFLVYKNNTCIIAEKISDFKEDMNKKCLHGKGFIRPIQFSKTGKMKSAKKTNRITNYLKGESFDVLNLKQGDSLLIEGTVTNDGIYDVMEVSESNNKEFIRVLPEVKDEDLIGSEVTLKVIQEPNVTI